MLCFCRCLWPFGPVQASEEEGASHESEGEVPWAGDDCIDEDVALEFSPPRFWPRGRPRKKLAAKRGVEEFPRRPRGRPKKDVQVEAVSGTPSVGRSSPTGPYFKRAKMVYFLSKYAGMEFLGSEEEAIRDLSEFLTKNGHAGS